MKLHGDRVRHVLLMLAILLLSAGSAATADMYESHAGRPMLIIAHRGANKFAPENTLPAIEKAIEMKLDYVELDVRTTKDGKLVLMHDGTVDRTTTGKGAVRDMTLDEIRQLDAGVWFGPEFKGTKVPTFPEVLKAIKGRINVYLDWKAATPEDLIRDIEAAGSEDEVLVLGDPMRLMMLHQKSPRVHLMVEADSGPDVMKELKMGMKFDAVSPYLRRITPGVVKACHKKKVKLFVDLLGKNDTCEGVKKAAAVGIDAVQSDFPDMVVRCMNNINEKKDRKE